MKEFEEDYENDERLEQLITQGRLAKFSDKNPIWIIYSLYCIPEDKIYIGQRKTRCRDLNDYCLDPNYLCSSKNPEFLRDWKKYDHETEWKHRVIMFCLDRESANYHESLFINEYWGPHCYNLTRSGRSWSDINENPELVEKSLQVRKETWYGTREHRDLAKSNFHNDEAERKKAATKRARGQYTNMAWNSPEALKKSAETRRKKRLAGLYDTPEHKAKLKRAAEIRNRKYNWLRLDGSTIVTMKSSASRMMHNRGESWVNLGLYEGTDNK